MSSLGITELLLSSLQRMWFFWLHPVVSSQREALDLRVSTSKREAIVPRRKQWNAPFR